MKKDKRTTPVSKKGWSLPTHFINTLVAAFSGICFLLSAAMWFSCPDPAAMAQAISSLF